MLTKFVEGIEYEGFAVEYMGDYAIKVKIIGEVSKFELPL